MGVDEEAAAGDLAEDNQMAISPSILDDPDYFNDLVHAPVRSITDWSGWSLHGHLFKFLCISSAVQALYFSLSLIPTILLLNVSGNDTRSPNGSAGFCPSCGGIIPLMAVCYSLFFLLHFLCLLWATLVLLKWRDMQTSGNLNYNSFSSFCIFFHHQDLLCFIGSFCFLSISFLRDLTKLVTFILYLSPTELDTVLCICALVCVILYPTVLGSLWLLSSPAICHRHFIFFMGDFGLSQSAAYQDPEWLQLKTLVEDYRVQLLHQNFLQAELILLTELLPAVKRFQCSHRRPVSELPRAKLIHKILCWKLRSLQKRFPKYLQC